ncbi:magnesium transporter [Amorphus orientalis]|uniref:Magnesium transporter MgtE n=1 Tax=Amorphus orientalis TaxID=649198 RepID=A0AAE3VPW6_9HYPH|nr:magnesium transporter [Amorphus orientalis]MDQ0316114.1 magnesium transporter [Amorphus orientalis]
MAEAAEADIRTEIAPLFRDDEGHLNTDFLEAVEAAVVSEDRDTLEQLIDGLHEVDVAELLTALTPELRIGFIATLGDSFDYTALTEVEEAIRLQILGNLPPHTVADGLAALDSDDAVYILEDLEEDEKQAILARLPFAKRHRLARSLDYPEETAGRRMQSDFVALPPFWSVGQVIDALREEEDLPDSFYQIFVVDPAFRLLGTVALDRLLRTPRPTRISEIMNEAPHTVLATEDQEEVAHVFQRYNLVSAAVVDENERLVGVLTIDDIVDIIEEEAEEDIRYLTGAGDAELSDTVYYTARTRIPWLLVNMATAFLAAFVIGIFDGTIQEMVALAVLMPIVASIGGNAGIQAMTVTVRALASKAISSRNTARVIGREVLVALANGSIIAAIVGLIAGLVFQNPDLGGVIAAALVFNVLCAGFFGVVTPILLNKLGADPAVASSVFLTTLTDVIGFLAFLGLAAWWFGIF